MTPYEISILLHYYAHPDDHPDMTRQPPIWAHTLARFINDGLLVATPAQPAPQYRAFKITERGEAYVEALTRLPLPVQRWVMP